MEVGSIQHGLTVHWNIERDWVLKFSRSDCDRNPIPGYSVTITRIDDTNWEIEGFSAILCKGSIKGKNKEPGGEAWSGEMPFFLTATRQ